MQTTARYTGAVHCLRETVKLEGVRALWKGGLPQMIVSMPYSGLLFSTYAYLKPARLPDTAEIPRAQLGRYYTDTFVAGSLSGVLLCLFQNPLDVWKVKLQTTYGSAAAPLQVKKPLARADLTRGMSMTALRNIPGNGVFLLSYEYLSRLARAHPELGLQSTAGSALTGAVTGATFHVLFYPSDVIKSRLMTDCRSVRAVLSSVMAAHGPLGLYRGLSLTLTRTVVVNAAGFAVLEAAQRRLGLAP